MSDFVQVRFEHVRRTIDPTDTEVPTTRFGTNYIEVRSARWSYCLDAAGRQVIRPVAVSTHLASSLSEDIGSAYREWRAMPVSADRVTEARALAASAYGVNGLLGTDVATMALREVILARSADQPEAVRYHRGRTTVLFSDAADPTRLFSTAVVFAPSGTPLRIETTDLTDAVAAVASDFTAGIASGRIRHMNIASLDLRVGTFCDAWAYRFEHSARSYESEGFLTTAEPDLNPYRFWPPFDYCDEMPLPLAGYETTLNYESGRWTAWNEAGRHGGARGNWDLFFQRWQIPDVQIAHHALLGDYGVSGGTPPTSDSRDFCPGETSEFETSQGNRLDTAFHDDLEDCHVGVILSHGGPLDGVPGSLHEPVQWRTRLDYWAYLHREGEPALGLNRLRYLLIGSCASMNWWKEEPGVDGGLEGDWMNFHVADGLRMACGHDGGYDSGHHDGYTYFSFYNIGDTALDAWHLASMKDNSVNCPVTVAYGGSEAEVQATMFDQRFVTTPGGTGWILAVASYPVALAP